jgi:signal transduction histidine kinase
MHTIESVNGTRRRLSEETLLRSIVERLADGIVIVNGQGKVRFANPAAKQLFGRDIADLLDSDFGFPLVDGETTTVDVVRPGSESITAELRIVDIDWEGERARLVSLRDITDRKRALERERQLERERAARAEAEAASQSKSEFLAMMSHELRTPLNAVIGYAELLDLGIAGPLTIDQRHQLSRIRASGRHLLGLVNEVLDLAKIEAGRLSVNIGAARAGDAADAALSLVQNRAEEKGIRFSGQCLGETASVYEGDEDRVRQILVNLVSNAVKFTDPGGEIALECGTTSAPDADARLHGSKQWVYLRVRDTGVGIRQEHLPHIFDPFVQGETGHTRSNDGSGLGLTISRRLARMMGGDLTVQSTPGRGSVFTLWLPAATSVALPERLDWHAKNDGSQRVHGLSELGELLLRELENILESLAVRFRGDELSPAARALRFSQLVDHFPSYLADLGGMLVTVEETGGQPSSLLADASEIQRVIAERHGLQRARLGWSVEAVRREYEILREELTRAIRRRARAIPDSAVDEGLAILTRVIEQAAEASARGWQRARSAQHDEAVLAPPTPRDGEHDGASRPAG